MCTFLLQNVAFWDMRLLHCGIYELGQLLQLIAAHSVPWPLFHLLCHWAVCPLVAIWGPGPRFNIKMSSYQYRKSHCGDKTVVRSSYLHNGISYTGNMSSLYWIGTLYAIPGWGMLMHWGRDKWMLFCRRHFQMHFLEWKCMNFA